MARTCRRCPRISWRVAGRRIRGARKSTFPGPHGRREHPAERPQSPAECGSCRCGGLLSVPARASRPASRNAEWRRTKDASCGQIDRQWRESSADRRDKRGPSAVDDRKGRLRFDQAQTAKRHDDVSRRAECRLREAGGRPIRGSWTVEISSIAARRLIRPLPNALLAIFMSEHRYRSCRNSYIFDRGPLPPNETSRGGRCNRRSCCRFDLSIYSVGRRCGFHSILGQSVSCNRRPRRHSKRQERRERPSGGDRRR